MKIITTRAEMRQLSHEFRRAGSSVACVPTMGYLHEGHLSLIDRAHKEADKVVLTLFVNPIQFGPGEDYDVYPRDARRDIALCRERGVDALFMPEVSEMYSDDASIFIDENSISQHLCGLARPGHFRGVCTVVAKLFNTVLPDVAIFGQKDAQQVAVIRRMVRDLDFPVRIVASPIVREVDGLALSSRNTRLSPSERQNALGLSHALKLAEEAFRGGQKSAASICTLMSGEMCRYGLRVDYAAAVDCDSFEEVQTLREGVLLAVAAYAGETRLIDNLSLRAL